MKCFECYRSLQIVAWSLIDRSCSLIHAMVKNDRKWKRWKVKRLVEINRNLVLPDATRQLINGRIFHGSCQSLARRGEQLFSNFFAACRGCLLLSPRRSSHVTRRISTRNFYSDSFSHVSTISQPILHFSHRVIDHCSIYSGRSRGNGGRGDWAERKKHGNVHLSWIHWKTVDKRRTRQP